MPVTTLTDKRVSEILRYEEPIAQYSRSVFTASAAIVAGDLLKIDASGNATVAAVADLPTAVAIYPAASGEKFTAIARHAVVNINNINWASGITAAQKAAQIASLSGVGILARD